MPHKGTAQQRHIDQHVGERVRARRAQIGMSQEDLGKHLGISYQQMQKMETAANRIGAGRLHEIARVLRVDIGYFFEGLPKDATPAPEPTEKEKLLGQIMAMASQLSGRKIETVAEFVSFTARRPASKPSDPAGEEPGGAS